MTYFVLGSNSFAGSVYANELLNQGHKVIGVSRSPQPNAVLKPYAQNAALSNFQFHQLDLNLHFEQIKTLIAKEKPEYVIDFASQSMVAESWQHPEQWFNTNVVAKVQLHNFLRQCDFLQRYVRISTPEVYGHADGKISEQHAFNPTTPYAVSQAATDMSLNTFYKQYQFPVLFTRFANFYGPYQQLYRIIPKAIIFGLLKKKLPLHGGGASKRAFIFGSDIAQAINQTIEKGRLGETYHFSDSECISIAAVVQRVAKQIGVPYEDMVEISAERPGKDLQYYMATDKAASELGYQTKTSLDQGIEKTVAWVQMHLETIKTMPLNYIHKA